jgi:hypothetical protein
MIYSGEIVQLRCSSADKPFRSVKRTLANPHEHLSLPAKVMVDDSSSVYKGVFLQEKGGGVQKMRESGKGSAINGSRSRNPCAIAITQSPDR